MGRIKLLDSLRGFFIIIMMVDHLQLFAFSSINHLLKFTYQTFGFVSAAEGFIFLSGIMGGLIYGKMAIASEDLAIKKIKSRVLSIYKYHLLTVGLIALAFLVPVFNESWNITWEGKLALWKENPLRAFVLSSFFLYQTSFVDVLPLYVFLMSYFVLLIPYLVSNDLKSVVLFSLSFWIIGQFFPQQFIGNSIGFLLGWFEFFSWQFLFTLGVLFGFIQVRSQGIPVCKNIFRFSVLISLSLFLVRHFYVNQGPVFDMITNVRNLGIVRILNVLGLSYIFFYIYKSKKVDLSIRYFEILGKNSLSVFSFHLVAVYYLGAFEGFFNSLGKVGQYIFFIVSILSLYIPVIFKYLKLRFLKCNSQKSVAFGR